MRAAEGMGQSGFLHRTTGCTMQKSRLSHALGGAHSAALSQSAGNGSESPRVAARWLAVEAHLPRVRSLVSLREERRRVGALHPPARGRDSFRFFTRRAGMWRTGVPIPDAMARTG